MGSIQGNKRKKKIPKRKSVLGKIRAALSFLSNFVVTDLFWKVVYQLIILHHTLHPDILPKRPGGLLKSEFLLSPHLSQLKAPSNALTPINI